MMGKMAQIQYDYTIFTLVRACTKSSRLLRTYCNQGQYPGQGFEQLTVGSTDLSPQ